MKCNYCGFEATSLQALRAHLRRCRERPRMEVRSIRISDEDWSFLKGFCRRHGLTTCHAIRVWIKLLRMVDEGRKATLTFEDGKMGLGSAFGSNPIILNLSLHETWLKSCPLLRAILAGGPTSRQMHPLQRRRKSWRAKRTPWRNY